MVKVTIDDIEVDRCTDCQGLFFDEFEKERLRKLKGAESLDVGDPKTGKEFNRVDRIHCPRCSSQMIRMVDIDQPHIWFEHCTVCGGAFFDAGEFRELSQHSITGFFKNLVAKERR